MTMLGRNTAIETLSGVAAIVMVGPPYLIKTEIAAEAISTLKINPALLFIDIDLQAIGGSISKKLRAFDRI